MKHICPCDKCKYKPLREDGTCNNGFGICKEYLDYQKGLREMREVASRDMAYAEALND